MDKEIVILDVMDTTGKVCIVVVQRCLLGEQSDFFYCDVHNTTQHNTTQHSTTQDNTRQDKTIESTALIYFKIYVN